MVPGAKCASHFVVMKGERNFQSQRRPTKNKVGIFRILSFVICFFLGKWEKLGKWLFSSGCISLLNINIYNIWRLYDDDYEHKIARQLETFKHAL